MPHATVAGELLELEKQYWRAMKDRDADAAMRLSDEPCVIVGAQGVGKIDRKTLGAMLENATYTIDDVSVSDEDVEVRMLRDDVAILAYKVHEELTVDGKRVTIDAADSSTWIRRDGRWVCAVHTESLTGDPFGRDRRAR